MRRKIMIGVFVVAFAGRVNGQAPAVPTAQKDAGVATLLGIVLPGGGHFYSEETGRGVLYMLTAAAAVGIGAALSNENEYVSRLETVPKTSSNPLGLEFREYLSRRESNTPLLIGAAVASAVWLVSVIDAPRAARRANTKRGRVSILVSPSRVGIAAAF
jgi:hypothetical protein